MKRHLIALTVCIFINNCVQAGTRNMIMAFDFDRESLQEEFKSSTYRFTSNELGPVTNALLTGIYQQTAPILVSSVTWRNALERGKAFGEAIKGGNGQFLTRYPLFQNSQNLKAFFNDLRKEYDPTLDLMRTGKSLVPVQYYHAYQTFYSKDPVFKPSEWIIKKVSDYLYLFIPLKYVRQLEQRKDTPDIARKTAIPLSPRERLLGIKYGKLADLSLPALLDVNAHPDVINNSQYKNLVPSHSYKMVERLLYYKWHKVLEGYMFGQHVIRMLPLIFVTHSDLKMPGGDRDDTDINESFFMHEWLIYLIGHGSLSSSGPLQPIIQDQNDGIHSSIGYTGGIDQGAFRDLLSFFNNRVNTGALVYTSCYSGGQHLFKLYEHNWDYPKRKVIGKKAQITKETILHPDVFNFLIIATNMFYSVTATNTFSYWSNGNHYERLARPSLNFTNFFSNMAYFLHNQPALAAPKQVKGKKEKLSSHPGVEQQLAQILTNVTQFNVKNNYQIPAIRFPFTEWFVPLYDAGQMIRMETQQVRDARLNEDMRIKVMLQALANKKGLPSKVQQSIDAYAKEHGMKVPLKTQPQTVKPQAPLAKPGAQQAQPSVTAQPLKPTQTNAPQIKPVVQPQQVNPQSVKPVQPVVQPHSALPIQPVQPQPVKPIPQPPTSTAQTTPLIQALQRLESSLYGVITEFFK